MKRTFYLSICTLLSIIGCVTSSQEEQESSTMSRETFFSDHLSDSILYNTYLPAGYVENDSMPILYLLHGHGGNDSTWVKPQEGNIQWILDSLINNKLIPPLIAVTLDAANTWYVDRHRKMESAFIKDFIPYFESKFTGNSQSHDRIIAGNSAGGYGALRFTLKYPELFYASILLSPAAYYPEPPVNSSSRKIQVFNKDSVFSKEIWQSYAHTSLLSNYTNQQAKPILYISSGDDDDYGIVDVVTQLRTHLLENEIPHELTIVNGGHDWKVWSERFTHDLILIFETYNF